MPPITLARLKDELLDLYGEDQIAAFMMMTASSKVQEWLKDSGTTINHSLSFGRDNPNNSGAIADYSVKFDELLARCDPSSRQAKAARARLIVFAYTLWEKVYRPAIKLECGLDRDDVQSNAFGDLRIYRNAILHRKGELVADTTVLTVFRKGDAIEPTSDQLREIFEELVSGINDIGARYYGEDPGFALGRRLNS